MQWNKINIQKVETLNALLTNIEQKSYEIAKRENQKVLKKLLDKEDDICEYELDLNFIFLGQNGFELLSHQENMKYHFLKDKDINFNDGKNHNVLKSLPKYKALHDQKHCWLLHSLYDDYLIPWEIILTIKEILFEVNVVYQYESKVNNQDIKLS